MVCNCNSHGLCFSTHRFQWRAAMASRSARTTPKCKLQDGVGAWVEAMQGRAVTLVRNEQFLSPGSGKKKTYANHTIHDQIAKTPTALVSHGSATGDGADSGQFEGFLTDSVVSSEDERQSTDLPSWMQPSDTVGQALRRKRRDTQRKVLNNSLRDGTKRPGTGMQSTAAERPGSSRRARLRPSVRGGKDRPKSSMGDSSSLKLGELSQKRPQTSMGTRSLGPGDVRKRADFVPARTPLRPVSSVGWVEQRQAEQNFLRFLSGGDSPPRQVGPCENVTAVDSKETGTLNGQMLEEAGGHGANRAARKPRWQEIISLRKNERMRRIDMVDSSWAVDVKARAKVGSEYHAPPVVFTEAAERLKGIKGQPAGHRFWVEKRDRTAFSGKTSFGMAGRLRQRKEKASVNVHQEHELIKALLHAQGRAEPLNANAEKWISAYSSLMDKRQKLRQLESILAQAQADLKTAHTAVNSAQHRAQKGSTRGLDSQDVSKELEEALERAEALEVKVAETQTRCRVFTISIKEYERVQPSLDNDVGHVEEWTQLAQDLREHVFEAEGQGHLRKAQELLDNQRKGWWQEWSGSAWSSESRRPHLTHADADPAEHPPSAATECDQVPLTCPCYFRKFGRQTRQASRVVRLAR